MSDDSLDFNPVSRITVGAIGRPGERVFFIQATQGYRLISLKMEKEQVAALARGIEALLEELEQREILAGPSEEEPSSEDLALQEPLEPIFSVGQMGLGFDRAADMMVLIIQSTIEDEEQDPLVARFWVSRRQMRALAHHAREVVAQGRPICALCNRPIDPAGHLCPRRNGHSKGIVED